MFARTPRLLLRPGWKEDAAELHRRLGDEAVLRGLGWPAPSLSLEETQSMLATPQDPLRPQALIVARTFGAPRLVGGIALSDGEEADAPSLDLWIARPCWGLGFATEAGRAMIAFARDTLRLPHLRARSPAGGIAAGRLLAKLGFRSDGAGGFGIDLRNERAALAV